MENSEFQDSQGDIMILSQKRAKGEEKEKGRGRRVGRRKEGRILKKTGGKNPSKTAQR